MMTLVQLEVGSAGRRMTEAVPADGGCLRRFQLTADEPPDASPPARHHRGGVGRLGDHARVPARACAVRR